MYRSSCLHFRIVGVVGIAPLQRVVLEIAFLVAYFSASGVTEKAAQQLAEVTGAELHEIAPAVPYSSADLNWMNKKSRSTIEMNDPASRPALAEEHTDLTAFDTVYIGFPIWWGVVPRVVNTFIENNDLSGKTVVIFATSGGSGLNPAVRDLQKKYPALDIRAGQLIRGSVTQRDRGHSLIAA